MRRSRLIPLLVLPFLIGPSVAVTQSSAAVVSSSELGPIQQRLLSRSSQQTLDTEARPKAQTVLSASTVTNPATLCPQRLGSNIAVNQNCANVATDPASSASQVQTEPSVAVDPNNPRNLVASYNDYRRGDTTCGVSYSRDGGRRWADATAPTGFVDGGFTGGNRHYYQAGGDSSVAWDSRGNAYLACLMSQRSGRVSANQDTSNGIYVYRSTGSGGATWSFPARAVDQIKDLKGNGIPMLDKPLMAVDASTTSRFRDRIYVAYTRFDFDTDITGYIYLSYSEDYGQTFSPPVLVSRDSSLCPNPTPVASRVSRCTSNSFAQPFTAADGTLYVTWSNYNTAASGGGNPKAPKAPKAPSSSRMATTAADTATKDNHHQILLATSTDGGATFTDPVKVGSFYDTPYCGTYLTDIGSCLPEKAATTNSRFGTGNYPSGAVNPRTGEVTIAFGSYISRNSNEKNGCVPNGFGQSWPTYVGVKTIGACNNDILVSVSKNGGASFTGTTIDPRQLDTLTGAPGQRSTDQFFQWIGYTSTGTLAVSYYDRQYGNSVRTGSFDVSVSSARRLSDIKVRRVTASSMPPPTQFRGRSLGDYAGLAISGNNALPVWPDTRSLTPVMCPGTGTAGRPPKICTAKVENGIANDQQIFTAQVPLG